MLMMTEEVVFLKKDDYEKLVYSIEDLKKKTRPLVCYKTYFQQKRSAKKSTKSQIYELIRDFNDRIQQTGLQISNLVLEPICEDKPSCLQINESTSIDKSVSVELCLQLKDTFCISDWNYSAIQRYLSPNIQTISEVRNARIALNNSIKWRSLVTENITSSFVDPQTFIKKQCRNFIRRNSEKVTNKIIIKLSGDGTLIGKKLNIINFTFTIINEGTKATTQSGNYTLAVVKCKGESYNGLAEWLPIVIEQIANLKSITFNDEVYDITYKPGGDMKILNLMLGLKAPNSGFPCFICEAHTTDFVDYKSNFTKRSRERQQTAIKKKGKLKNEKCHYCERTLTRSCEHYHLGYSNTSLLEPFEFSDVVPDTLHMMLRICDQLLENMIVGIMNHDKMTKSSVVDLDNENKYPNAVLYFRLVKKYLGLNLTPNVREKNSKISFHRQFTGGEYIDLMKNIEHFTPIFELKKQTDLISDKQLWIQFYSIYSKIKAFSYKTAESLANDTHEWMQIFLQLYQSDRITPYIHIFASHLHEMIDRHGNFNLFNCQGLEKLNDYSTLEYFRATNKKGNVTAQILKHRLRIAFLEEITGIRIQRVHDENRNTKT
jgi:hypothetical protein